jgi:hypothetical protein
MNPPQLNLSDGDGDMPDESLKGLQSRATPITDKPGLSGVGQTRIATSPDRARETLPVQPVVATPP